GIRDFHVTGVQTCALPILLRQIARHGQDRRYHHIRVGVNSRLDTLQAAVLLPKLAILDEEIAARQQVAARYAELLADAPVVTPYVESHNNSVYGQYTVRVNDREQVQAQLKDAGVPTAVHYPIPLNKQPAVADAGASLPEGDAAAEQVISLPMHPYLAVEDQQRVISVLSAASRSG